MHPANFKLSITLPWHSYCYSSILKRKAGRFFFFMEGKIMVMFECLPSYHCQIVFSGLVDCQSLVCVCVFYPETFDCLYLYLVVIPWMLT